jgi:large subunit ribosomal protein L32
MLPKKRQSKTRSKKRRTHYKSTLVHTVKCKNTGVEHLPHHAYYHDGILYYKGKPVD